jgi:hypothetical protein
VFGYNGTKWSIGTVIDVNHALVGISCPSISSCVAVDNAGRAFISEGTAAG